MCVSLCHFDDTSLLQSLLMIFRYLSIPSRHSLIGALPETPLHMIDLSKYLPKYLLYPELVVYYSLSSLYLSFIQSYTYDTCCLEIRDSVSLCNHEG